METLILKKHLSKLYLVFSILLAASIPFPIKIHNAVVVTFFMATILAMDWPALGRRLYLHSPLVLLIGLHFLMVVLGLLYSSDVPAGIGQLERAIYPLFILLLLSQSSTSKDLLKSALIAFTSGCVGLTLYGFFVSWIELEPTDFLQMLDNGHLHFTAFISIQPLYLSVYFTLVFFFSLELLRTKRNEMGIGIKLFMTTLAAFTFVMILFLRSKTGLIVFPTLLILYLMIVLKKRGWLVAFVLITAGFITFLLDSNQAMNLLNEYGRTVSSAFDERTSIWRGAIEGIKESPWIGGGTGGDQDLLNSGYAKIGYQEGIDSGFNAHNQYLQFMARNGVVELACFLTLLAYSFWESSKRSNYTFLMFNMLVSFVMLTESFLSVQKGIAFFYFFLVAFHFLPDEKSNQPNSV